MSHPPSSPSVRPKLAGPIPTMNDSKRDLCKFLLQVLISILTAIATALGTTSCMTALAMV